MKNSLINRHLRYFLFSIFFFVLFLSWLLLSGCAEKQYARPEPVDVKTTYAAQPADPAGKLKVNAGYKILADEHGKYRLIETPFGTVKQRVKDDKPLFTAEKPVQEEIPPVRKVTANVQKKLPVILPDQAADVASVKKKTESKKPEKEDRVILNFDNADIYEVIRTFGEILNLNYIIDPGIRGKVTIQTAGRIEKKDLFNVFLQILDANNLTAVKEGSLHRIVASKDAARMPLLSGSGALERGTKPGEDYIIQLVPLEHIAAQEITKLLSPFLSGGGTITSHQDTNTLVIVDKALNIFKLLKLVKAFDINIFEKTGYRFYPLEHVDAEETAKILEEIFGSYGYTKDDLALIGIDRINTLLLISDDTNVFKKAETFLAQIDIEGDDIESRIFVYSVKNSEAGELADLLNSIFGKSGGKTETVSQKETNKDKKRKPLFPGSPFDKKKAKEAKGVRRKSGEGSGTLKDEIRVTADEIRNVLIIEAIPSDYRIVENILNRIDVLPRQVLIEVTVADISLTTKKEIGIEWEYAKGEGQPSTSLIHASLGSSGLNYLIGQTARWKNTLAALATKNKVNILSSPSVLASDNKEATINVTTEVPVVNTTYHYTDDSDNVIPSTIEYRNTGIILSVTPHINEHGLVSMDISQEVSAQAGNVQVGNGQSAASFFNRSVSTSLTVKHGQTVVIGGLIRETKSSDHSGVMFLSDIPLIGYLFGRRSNNFDKTELIILITPRVIATLDDVDVVTEEFKRKAENSVRMIRNIK